MTIEAASKQLTITDPFYGLFLMQTHREITDRIETLAVAPHNVGVKLMINQEFWDSLNDKEQIAVLKHELSHIFFSHIFMRNYFDDPELFNMAADLEVNSYLTNLPDGCLLPEQFGFQRGKGTKWYYEQLKEQGKGRLPVFGHDLWKEFSKMSEDMNELIKNQVDYQLKESVKNCDRGLVPNQFRERIDSLFQIQEQIFNWKAYFRNMLAGILDIKLKKTHRRESIRFEGGAGIKFKKKINILVAIDTSGSVSNDELCDFFSEIHHIYKAGANIRILECDTQIHRNYIYNGKWDEIRCAAGGTVLKPCSDYFMEHRREYSKFIIFTDGFFDLEEIQSPKENNIFIITSDGKHQNYPGKTIYIPKIQ